MHVPPLSVTLGLNYQQQGEAVKYGQLFSLSNGILTPIGKKYNFFCAEFQDGFVY